MAAVTATEFARNFGKYKEQAQQEPVAITSHGRISGYFVAAREYAELCRLRKFERRVYRTNALPKKILEAIRTAKMEPGHEHLDALLDDE